LRYCKVFETKGERIMSKGQNAKKGSKKEPQKSMKEKKAAKRDKKNENTGKGILDHKLN
jgi:hypothetical protein